MLRGISTNRNLTGAASCLHAEDIAFACRYYSATTTSHSKRLVRQEAAALIGNGIKIVVVYEDGPTEVDYFTPARGELDGRRAHDYATAIGQPSGTAIYFAVDYDAIDVHVRGPIRRYFERVAAGLAAAGGGTAKYAVGVYGSGRVCSHIKEATKLAVYSWLAESHRWGGHGSYLTPDIRQEVSTSGLCQLAPGVNGDYEDNFASGEFGAFSSIVNVSGAEPLPSPAPREGPTEPSAFARRVAALGQQQYALYHRSSEEEPPLAQQIRAYWEEIGFVFPGVATAWSAVFISWLMRTSGAEASEFKVSTMHSRFVYWAINNSKANKGLFQAQRLEDYAPTIGDIIHSNRGGQNLDYSFAAAHEAYESHSAIVVQLGADRAGAYAITTGGNEGNTVGQKRVSLHPDGTVMQRVSNPYICVVQNLK